MAAFTPGPFSDVAVTSFTASWASTFPAGTTFYAQVSTNASFAPPITSSNTLNLSATFSGLIPNSTYYAQVATAVAGPFTSLASTVTLLQVPVSVVFDEVSSNTIVAAAYAPTPAFSNLGIGLSGTNVAKDGVYQGWHGEKWTAKTAMTTARNEMAVGAVGGRLYAIGGNNGVPLATNEEYDPAANAWTAKAAMPTARHALAAGVVAGKVYAMGGNNGANLTNNEEYDPAADAWATKAAMTTARQLLAAGEAGGKVYALGGNISGTPQATNEEYEPATNAWTTKAAMTTARQDFAVGVVGGRVYAVGGADGSLLAINEEYNPATNAWTAKAAMATARRNLSAGVVGGKIYALGGFNGVYLATNEEYDPAANTWTTKAAMATARQFLAAGVLGGKVYALGGHNGASVATNEEYDPGTSSSFTALTPNTLYSFRAKARNSAGVETGETLSFSTYTLAAVPSTATPTFTGVFVTSVAVQWLANGNPAGTEFRLHASTASDFNAAASSQTGSWQTSLVSTTTSLSAFTTWYFRAQARNTVGVETAYGVLGSTLTRQFVPGRMVILLGPQTLTVGAGVTGNPSAETAGEFITVTVKAADADFNFTPAVNKSSISLVSDDSFVQSSWTLTFVNGVSISSIPLRSAGVRAFTVSDQSGTQPLLASVNSSTFTLSASNPVRLRVLLPGQTAVAGSTATGRSGAPSDQSAGVAFTATVHLTDSFWNLKTSASQQIRLVADDPYAVIVPTAQVVTTSAAFTVTPTRAGSTFLRAEMVDSPPPSGPSVATDTATALTVLSGVATRLLTLVPGESFSPGSPNGKAGTPLTNLRAGTPFQVTVSVVDSLNNLVAGRAADVRLKLPAGSPFTLSATTASIDTAVGYTNPYMPASLFARATWYQLIAEDYLSSGLQDSSLSSTFTIRPNLPVGLQLLVPGQANSGGAGIFPTGGKTGTPSTATAGAPFTATVNLVDTYNNLFDEDPSDPRVGLLTNDPNDVDPLVGVESALVSGNLEIQVTPVTKSTGLVISAYALSQVVDQVCTGNSSPFQCLAPPPAAASPSFAVSAATASRLMVLLPGETLVPGSGKAGTPSAFTMTMPQTSFQVTVNLIDDYYNIAAEAPTMPTVGVSLPSDALATPPASAALSSGTLSFAITPLTALSTYTVSAATVPSSALTVSSGISASFPVLPGPAHHLHFTNVPSTESAGSAFPVTLIAHDQFHNLLSTGPNKYLKTAQLSAEVFPVPQVAGFNQPGVFTSADNGVKTINNAFTLMKAGTRWIKATQTDNSFVNTEVAGYSVQPNVTIAVSAPSSVAVGPGPTSSVVSVRAGSLLAPGFQAITGQLADAFNNAMTSPSTVTITVKNVFGSTGTLAYDAGGTWVPIGPSTTVLTDALGRVGVSTPFAYFTSTTAGHSARIWIGTSAAPGNLTPYIAGQINLSGTLSTTGGVPSQLIFTSTTPATAATDLPAGGAAFVIRRRDDFGNPTDQGATDINLTLPAGEAAVRTNAGLQAGIPSTTTGDFGFAEPNSPFNYTTTVSIQDGQTDASFRFRDRMASYSGLSPAGNTGLGGRPGRWTMNVVSTNVAVSSLTFAIQIDPAAPVKLAFSNAVNSIVAGKVYEAGGVVLGSFQVQVQDAFLNPRTSTNPISVALSTFSRTPSTLFDSFSFSASSTIAPGLPPLFQSPVTSVTVAALAYETTFFYLDTKAATPIVQAADSAGVLLSTRQSVAIVQDSISLVAVLPLANSTLLAGTTTALLLQTQDRFGNPSVVQAGQEDPAQSYVEFSLVGSSPGPKRFASPSAAGFTNSTGTARLIAGQHTTTFFLIDTFSSTTVRQVWGDEVQDRSWSVVLATYTVIAEQPAVARITTPVRHLVAGSTGAAIDVEFFDAYGNPTVSSWAVHTVLVNSTNSPTMRGGLTTAAPVDGVNWQLIGPSDSPLSIGVPTNSGLGRFYVWDTQPGTKTVSAAVVRQDGYTLLTATQSVVIEPTPFTTPPGCALTFNVAKTGASYTTLTAALAAIPASLSAETCVVIRDTATYQEQVTISNKTPNGFRLRILGDTSLSGPPTIDPPAASTAAFQVKAASVSIETLRVAPSVTVSWGIAVSSSYVTVSGVVVQASTQLAVAGIGMDAFGRVEFSTVSAGDMRAVYFNGAAAHHGVLYRSSFTNASSGNHTLWLSGPNNTILESSAHNASGTAVMLGDVNCVMDRSTATTAAAGRHAADMPFGSSSTTITRSFIRSSVGRGLNMSGSYLSVADSTITTTGTGEYALTMIQVTHSTVSRTYIYSATGIAASLSAGANWNRVEGSTIVAGNLSAFVAQSSSFNTVSGSVLRSAIGSGLRLTDLSNGNLIQGSTLAAYGTGEGAGIVTSSGNTISSCYIYSSSGTALDLRAGSNGNTIQQSTLLSDAPAAYALYMTTAASNSILSNMIINTTGYAAFLGSNANANLIDLSTVTARTSGFSALYLDNASTNTVSRSYLYNLAGNAVTFGFAASSNTLSKSTAVASGPTSKAFYLYSAPDTWVSDSWLMGAGYGVYAEFGQRASITRSTVTGSGSVPAFMVAGSSGISLRDSYVAGPDALDIFTGTATVAERTLFQATGASGRAVQLRGGSVGITLASATLKASGVGLLIDAVASGPLTIASMTVTASTGVQFQGGTHVATVTLAAFPAGVSVNVDGSGLGPGARITMRDYYGSKSGAGFENDPSGRVDWILPPTLSASSFTGVFVSSLTANWGSTFPGGTTYYAQISTNASFAAPVASSNTLNFSATFAGLIPNTTYYAQVATAAAGPFISLSSTVTLVQAPVSVVFDEIFSNTIVAAAYAPTPAFSNLGAGLSGTNVAIDGVYQGWHGEQWTTKTAMTTARMELAASALGGKLYAVGGNSPILTTNSEYDPAANAWTAKAAMPTARTSLTASAVGGKLYAVGGWDGIGAFLATNEEYDPAANAWTGKAAMPTARRMLAASAVGGKLYAVGGWNGSYLATNEEYDPAANAWTGKAAMPSARRELAASAVGGKLYAVGGWSGTVLATNEEYNPATNAWTGKAAMPTVRWGLAASAVGEKLYAVGGHSFFATLATNEEYDPAANAWTGKVAMPSAREFLAASAVGGKLYALGGYVDGPALATNEAYDPGTASSFTALTPNTLYNFKAKARNLQGTETGETAVFSTYTLAAVPGAPTFTGVFITSVAVQWLANGNPGGTQFRASASTATDFNAAASSQTGSWQTSLVSTMTSLSASTTWYFRVQARNTVGIETAYNAIGSTRTAAYPAPPGCGLTLDVAKSGAAYSTLTAALAAVPASLSAETCVVIRDTATYQEQVTVSNKTPNGFRLRIMGDPTLSGPPTIDPPAASTAAFQVKAASVSIETLRIAPSVTLNWGIAVTSAFVTVSRVLVESSTQVVVAAIDMASFGRVEFSTVAVGGARAVYFNGAGAHHNTLYRSTFSNASAANHTLWVSGPDNTIFESSAHNTAGVAVMLGDVNCVMDRSTTTAGAAGNYAASIVAGSSSNTITRSFLRSSVGRGLSMAGTYHSVVDSTITTTGTAEYGLAMVGVTHSTVSRAFIYSATGIAATLIAGANWNRIEGSTVIAGNLSAFVAQSSSFNMVSGSVLRSVIGSALRLTDLSNGNQIQGSTLAAYGTGGGASIDASSSNSITSCYIYSSSGTAMDLRNGANANTIQQSTLLSDAPAAYALYMTTAASNSIVLDMIANTTGYAAFLGTNANGNQIDRSTITSRPSGYSALYLDNASTNTISRSYLYSLAGNAVTFGFAASSNTLSKSTAVASGSASKAFYLYSAPDTWVSDSWLQGAGYGVYAEFGQRASFTRSTVTGSGAVPAFMVAGSSGILLRDSYVAGPDALDIFTGTATLAERTVFQATGGSGRAVQLRGGSVGITLASATLKASAVGLLIDATASGPLVIASMTVTASTGVQFQGGTHVATITLAAFPTGVSVNVDGSGLDAGARITMRDFYGPRSGAGFENDPSGRVDWILPSAVLRVWDGGGSSNLASEAANWVGDTAPLSGDSVLFDGTNGSKYCLWNLGAVEVSSFTMAAGFSTTVVLNIAPTVVNDFSIAGGTLTGRGFTLKGNMVQTGGFVNFNVINTPTVVFEGSNPQTVSMMPGSNLGIPYIGPGSTVTAASDLTMVRLVYVEGSDYRGLRGTLNLGSGFNHTVTNQHASAQNFGDLEPGAVLDLGGSTLTITMGNIPQFDARGTIRMNNGNGVLRFVQSGPDDTWCNLWLNGPSAKLVADSAQDLIISSPGVIMVSNGADLDITGLTLGDVSLVFSGAYSTDVVSASGIRFVNFSPGRDAAAVVIDTDGLRGAVSFYDSYFDVTVTTNVDAVNLAAGVATITFVNAGGPKAGPLFENDPNNAVIWPALSTAPFAGVNSSSLTANWGSTFPGGTFYYAQISTNASFAAPVASSDTLNLSATFSGLFANTTYYARVATASAGPFISMGSTITLVPPPVLSTNAFTAVSSSALTASWGSTFPGGTLYYAQISTNSSFASPVISSNTLALSASFSGLSPGTTYYARVATAPAGPFTILGSTRTRFGDIADCATSRFVRQAGGGDCTSIGTCIAQIPSTPLTGDFCISVLDSAVYSEQVTVINKNPNGFKIRIWGAAGARPAVNPPAGSTAGIRIANSSVSITDINVITTNTVSYGVLVSSSHVSVSSVSVDSGGKINAAGVSLLSWASVSDSSITVQNAHGLLVGGSYNGISRSSATAAFAGLYGMYLNGASSNSITDAYAYALTGFGLFLQNSHANTISRSTLRASNGSYQGLRLTASATNTISECMISNSGGEGSEFFTSNNNLIRLSTITAAGAGYEALLMLASSSNTLAQSYVYSASGSGAVTTTGGSLNLISRSTLVSGAYGYAGGGFSGSSETLTESFVSAPNGYGFFLGDYGVLSYSTITNNSSSFPALSLSGTRGLVTRSSIHNAGGPGGKLDRATYNLIEQSTITAADELGALIFEGASSNTVSQSRIVNSAGTGLYLSSHFEAFDSVTTTGTGNQFSELTIEGSTAVYISASPGVSLTSSTLIGGSLGYGLRLDAGNSGTLTFSSITLRGAASGLSFGDAVLVATFTGVSLDASVAVGADGTGLHPGSRITLRDASGSRAGSLYEVDPLGVVDWVPDPDPFLPPAAPTAPSGTALGTSSIAWTWAAVAGAESYRVRASSDLTLLASPVSTGVVLTGLSPNATYAIVAAGFARYQQGELSTSATVYTHAAPPLGLAAASVTASSAVLTWSLNGNPVGTFAELQRSTDGASYAVRAGTLAQTAFDTGLLGCTSYYYRVRNRNPAGINTDFAGPNLVRTAASTPSAPGDLSAQSVPGRRVALTWSASPTEGVIGYRLYIDTGAGMVDYSAPYAVFEANTLSTTTVALSSGSIHLFGLRAFHRCGTAEFNTHVVASAWALESLDGVRAGIKVPSTGQKISGNRVLVMADLDTGDSRDVSSLLFQYRSTGSATWTDIPAANINHPNPDREQPFFVHWDVSLLNGAYDLRAVASDVVGASDPAPGNITILVDSVDFEVRETDLGGGKVKKEQAVNNGAANTVSTAESGSAVVSKVMLPAGSLNTDGATLSATLNPPALPPPPAEATSLGAALEVTLSNGQSLLSGGLTAAIVFNYPDDDGDGVIDGTPVRAENAEIQTFDVASNKWKKEFATTVDKNARTLTGQTPHFSLFAAFGVLAGALDSIRVYPNPYKPNGGDANEGRPFNRADPLSGVVFDNLPVSVRITIYTLTGREVCTFGTDAGTGALQWDGKNDLGEDVASGGYFAAIKSPGQTAVIKKLAVIR